ncbi:MAG TPA: AAA family ATPase [Spirochaetia bacterium]|nr:AAA family ATPase [Spirochaetia bacterium]
MIKRILTPYLLDLAGKYPVILLTGPRQSGKTTLCRSAFPNLPYITLESIDIREYAVSDPRGFLEKYKHGAIFDEIQKAPDIPSYLQQIVDEPDFQGVFILTGSQNFSVQNSINQSLAGRTAVLNLLPFSLQELSAYSHLEKSDNYLLKGFYPRLYEKKIPPHRFYSDYLTTYIERDVRSILKIKDLLVFQRFMKLCAGRSAQLLNISALASDSGVTQKTAAEWLTVLEASYILFRLPPFYKNISKRLVKSPKLFFYDPGLMSRLLDIEDISQLGGHPLRGSIFETMVVSDMIKKRFNAGKANNFCFYRDSNNTEVDLILTEGARYVPVEIKSGKTINKDYFFGLAHFKKHIKESASGFLVYDGADAGERNNMHFIGFPHLAHAEFKI